MAKRYRRKASEIARIRRKLQQVIAREKRISLTELVEKHGGSIGVRNSPSDKNLLKRQLDLLAKGGDLDFKRAGRDLIATAAPGTAAASAPAPVAAPAPTPAKAAPSPAPQVAAAPRISESELQVIKAYAQQVEEFAKTLQRQIATLVRMVERAASS